jgi:hypothetical protein
MLDFSFTHCVQGFEVLLKVSISTGADGLLGFSLRLGRSGAYRPELAWLALVHRCSQ